MSKLIDCFSPLIDAALVMIARVRSDAPAPILVRDHLNSALGAARQAALAAGHNEAITDSAAFAIVAWIDEELVAIDGFGWGRAIEPLQKQHFHTLNAGNEFFQKLRGLNSGSNVLTDVYYLILCLGFKGQYERDPQELVKLRDQLALQSESRPQSRQMLKHEELYPQPYRVPDPTPVSPPVNRRRYWLLAAAAVLLALLGGLAWFLLNQPRSVEKITAEIDGHLKGYECAELDFNVDDARNVLVSGFVSSKEDATRLPATLGKMKDIGKVTLNLAVHVKPICEVLLLVKPYAEQTPSEQAPVVKINPKTGPLILGNKLVLDVEMGNFDGNIYVDLFDFEGNVVHFLPNEVVKQTLRPARNKFTIGEARDNNRTFELAPPAGEHLIIVFAAPQLTPVFSPLRPEVETATTYLPALRKALATFKDRNAKIAFGQPLLFESKP